MEKSLTSEQIHEFVRNGFLILRLPEGEVSASIHEKIYNFGLTYIQLGPELGNNIYPACAELDHIVTAPTLTRALKALLGPDYQLHRHRALHVSSLQGDQDWHKDASWGLRRMRTHRPRWAMAMYYSVLDG
jgi:hypothetical protein